MKQTSFRILLVPGVVLVSGALALGQARGGGATTEQSPEANSPTMNNPNNPGMNNGMNPNGEPPANQMQDKDFVHSALEDGMAEVQLGQLAAQKGSSDDVKQYGQKMVDANTQLGNQMKQLAQQMGVKPPKDLSKKDKQEVAKLNALSGADFDNAYISMMVKDHKRTVEDFKSEAQNSQNPTLQKVAQQDGPIIDQHLQIAEQLAKAHNQVASQ
jgi:putative membrane protein